MRNWKATPPRSSGVEERVWELEQIRNPRPKRAKSAKSAKLLDYGS